MEGLRKKNPVCVKETRVGNMRKDVSPEKRLLRITKEIEVPEVIKDLASSISAVISTPQNGRYISESMKQCFSLQDSLLKTCKDNKMQEILRRFRHLLAYRGLLVQQTFDELMPNRDPDKKMESFLRTEMTLDKNNWNNVRDRMIYDLQLLS